MLELSQLYDLIGVTKNGVVTLAAVLFSPYPQSYFPQLSIIATHVPGTEIGLWDEQGQRFIDRKRLEATLPEILEQAVGFVRNSMQVSTRIDPALWRRTDRPEYPFAMREVILNALVHQDSSIHTGWFFAYYRLPPFFVPMGTPNRTIGKRFRNGQAQREKITSAFRFFESAL